MWPQMIDQMCDLHRNTLEDFEMLALYSQEWVIYYQADFDCDSKIWTQNGIVKKLDRTKPHNWDEIEKK